MIIIFLFIFLLIWNLVILLGSSFLAVPRVVVITLPDLFDTTVTTFDEYMLARLLTHHARRLRESRAVFLNGIQGSRSRYDIDVFSGEKLDSKHCFIDYGENKNAYLGIRDSRILGVAFNDNILQKNYRNPLQTILSANACFKMSEHLPTTILIEWGHVNDTYGGIAGARNDESHHMRGCPNSYPDPLYGVEYQTSQLASSFTHALQKWNLGTAKTLVFYGARRPPDVNGGVFQMGDHGYYVMKVFLEETDIAKWTISSFVGQKTESLNVCSDDTNIPSSNGCVCYVPPFNTYRQRFILLPALGNIAGKYVPGASLLRVNLKDKTIFKLCDEKDFINNIVETEYLWFPGVYRKIPRKHKF